MFVNCTSLETAPDLPAATLAKQCYSFMFSNCFALTEAPVLPAKTLKERCYEQMFSYCSSVAKITCMATDISASGCTMDWTKGVALNGTFVKDPAMENWTTGTSGIPSGWTVEDFVEEEETEE